LDTATRRVELFGLQCPYTIVAVAIGFVENEISIEAVDDVQRVVVVFGKDGVLQERVFVRDIVRCIEEVDVKPPPLGTSPLEFVRLHGFPHVCAHVFKNT
jgi:hypothetical protein